jgi:thiamine-phosphate pyrophosphorylase
MRGLYAIVDLEALALRRMEPLDFARRVLDARPALLQLRAKLTAARDTLALARELAPLCRAAAVPFVLNDRADLALLAGADGVHLGQEDIPIAVARRSMPELSFGVSTHDVMHLEAALRERPTYVAFGPVFATRSKAAPDPVVGVEGLGRAHARARDAAVPLCAIGGIDLDNAARVAEYAEVGAVIAALLVPDAAVTQRARDLHARLGGTPA